MKGQPAVSPRLLKVRAAASRRDADSESFLIERRGQIKYRQEHRVYGVKRMLHAACCMVSDRKENHSVELANVLFMKNPQFQKHCAAPQHRYRYRTAERAARLAVSATLTHIREAPSAGCA